MSGLNRVEMVGKQSEEGGGDTLFFYKINEISLHPWSNRSRSTLENIDLQII